MKKVAKRISNRVRSKPTMTKETPIDPAVASDIDGDGKLDLDPAKAEQTIADLVILDHKLRDEGSSVADLLRSVARSTAGIHV